MLLIAAAFASDLRLTVLPNFGYTPDDGYGIGFLVDLHDRPIPGVRPRSLAVHTYMSSDGFQNQRLRFDLPGLGPFHVGGLFAYRAWQHDGYWGIGPDTVREPGQDYGYSLVQPFGHLALAGRVTPALELYGSLDARWSKITAPDGSLLAEERPTGIDGGLAIQVGAGAMLDTRDEVLDPHRGAVVEVGGRAVVTDSPFGGPFASVRTFVPFGPCVWATRLMGEHLFGDVPFYEMLLWGGFTPVMGLGGYETLRGLPYGRWRGPGKALLNTELRIDVTKHPFAGGTLQWQLAPLVDAAAVWTDTAPWPIHPTGGLGVRGVWSEGLVGRIDAAVGVDPIREDGVVVDAPSWGIYLAFAQMF